jgi:hypothetical protein
LSIASAPARPTSTTRSPAATSTTKWFAVATTAKPMAIGDATAKALTARFVVVRSRTMPTTTFQPTCRLGNAAYWFVRPGGCSAR